MRILVTGRSGQVVTSLAERASSRSDVELLFAARPDVDLTDEDSIRRAVAAGRPDIIINAAAYTAVDQAEDDPDLADQINGRAPGVLASAAREAGARMIQISTDYVFDGSATVPYTEDHPVAPLGAYGRSKLAGEEAVRAELRNHLILRTAWVYSPFGKNFVKTMLTLAETRNELTVVDDQHGNPTSALDIADALLKVSSRWRQAPRIGLGETFHFAGRGDTVWADFARAIFSGSAERGGASAAVTGIASANWPTKAERPKNSRLDSSKFEAHFAHVPPAWPRSLGHVLDRLVGQGGNALAPAGRLS